MIVSVVIIVVTVSGSFTITATVASIGGGVIRYHFPLWIWIGG